MRHIYPDEINQLIDLDDSTARSKLKAAHSDTEGVGKARWCIRQRNRIGTEVLLRSVVTESIQISHFNDSEAF
ncbi:hypothetical protein BMI79_08595 [Serratia oryzae]|uniref:Uncharacterized protein n=1 Tax=Serratia oryzae TaxID=2034155 RepID=A0A1S8CM45_9GAMM|nr:hypothetical protein BMI79_08595 [Serratia oryzae]